MLNQIRCPYCMETIDLSNEPIYCENCGKDISEVYHHLMPNAVKSSPLPSAAYHGGKSHGTRNQRGAAAGFLVKVKQIE